MSSIIRCGWVNANDPLYVRYHDEEWGVPLHGEHELFERLCLETNQAGLSWITILRKRENFRAAFDGFDPVKVAAYDAEKVAELMSNPGIVRNRVKIAAAIHNAQRFLEVQKQVGSFDTYLWNFVDGTPIRNARQTLADIPATTDLSVKLSKDLARRGFKFVGATICYAMMQAVGMVNDHTVDCFRYDQV